MTHRIVAVICTCAILASLAGGPLLGAKRDAWVEVRTPNFVIVSNAGEKQARKTALQFEQIHTLYRDSLAVAQGHPSPFITIFAVKDDKSLSELLPDYWTKGHAHPSGIFWTRMSQYYAAVNLDAQGANPYATMYHEYYHSLTIPYFPGLPLWLSEGLADFFGHSEINGNIAMMGMTDPRLLDELRHNKLIPLDVLFHVDLQSPYYNEQNKTSVFYAESWALVHYLMIGDNQSHRQMLQDYASALGSGATPDQAAAKAFGDLAKLQEQLARYISRFAFSFFQTKAPAEPPAADIRSRELSDAEEEAYRGGFFAVRGRPEATEILQNAVHLDPNLALAHQNLGLAEFFEGNRDSALASISEAVKLDPKDALTLYLRAYLSFSGTGGIPQDSQIEADLRQSIVIDPNFPPSYALLGLYLSNRQKKPDEALTFARKAVSLEPGNSSYLYDLAQVLTQMRRFDEAQFVAARASANARNAQERANVQQFLVYLQKYRSIDSGNGSATDGADEVASKSSEQLAPEPGKQPATKFAQAAAPSEAADSREVTGVVAQESCASGLKLQVTTPTETLMLRLQPGSHNAIRIMSTPSANFDICTSLKGERVTARYVPDAAKTDTGTIQQLTVLATDSSPSVQSPKSPSTGAGTKIPLAAGATKNRAPTVSVTLSGKVTAVTCSGNEMVMTLLVRDTEFALHAHDYTRVQFEEAVPFESGKFNPCTQMKDHEASVDYVVTDKEQYDGEIQAVEVGK
jgi:tetratricopeptide (TPR) repeat protein